MKKLVLLSTLMLSLSTFAAAPDLNIPNEAQLKGILEDFSGNMVHTTATGAHSATILGFEIGVVASSIESPNLKLEDPDVDKIANGGIYAKLELPLGFGVEVVNVPFETGDLDYDYTSMAAYYSWGTMISTKLKVFTIDANLTFTDSSGIIVDYKNSGYGANLTFGKKLLIIEPYVGVGYVNSESSLTATADIFGGASNIQTLASQGVSDSSTYFYGGLDLDLLFLSVGVEFSNPYGNNRVAGRVAFGF